MWGIAEPKWCCNVMVEAPNPCGMHSTFFSCVAKVFQDLDMLWMGIWVHPYMFEPVQVRVGFFEYWDMAESKWCYNVIVEAPNPHGVLSTSLYCEHKVL